MNGYEIIVGFSWYKSWCDLVPHAVSIERYFVKNWLTWLWRLVSPKSEGCPGRLEIPEVTDDVLQVLSPITVALLLTWGGQSFCSTQIFNWCNESQTNYEGKFALFKAHWLKNLYHTKLPSQSVNQSVQSLSPIQLFVTPWIAACQASLSITNSQSLLKLPSQKHPK